MQKKEFSQFGPAFGQTYDYIVVGAGSAGCVVARRLIDQTDAKVLLVEAGGDDVYLPSVTEPSKWLENVGSERDYHYQYSPSIHCNNRTLSIPRGKILGGSGSINGQVWARGQADNYNLWAEVSHPDWSFERVLPLFKKIEDWEDGETDFHGAGGPVRVERAKNLHTVIERFIEAGKRFGMPFLEDTNGISPEGIGPMSSNTKHGERWSPFRAYLQPVLQHPNLTVIQQAQVYKLIIRENHCIGIALRKNRKSYKIAAQQEVILCAGAIDSPRLLLLSGIGCADSLRNAGIKPLVQLPGVGRNLQDHPLLAGLCFESRIPLNELNNNLGGSTAYWKSNSHLSRPDLMLLPIQIPYLSPELAASLDIPEHAFTLLPTLVQPKSRGFLQLAKSVRRGELIIQPNFLEDHDDVNALVDAVKICQELSAQPSLQKVIKRPLIRNLQNDKAIRQFIRNACMSYAHPVGTCAMGTGPEAVVDPELKVHGIEGLRVADASIMPSITAGNTNAPTLMIAEFASALLTKTKCLGVSPAAKSVDLEAL